MMAPVTRIALRRIRQGWQKSLLISVATCFFTLLISFFLSFEWQILNHSQWMYDDLPFTEFLKRVVRCMNITLLFLILLVCMTIRIYCNVRREENKKILGILTSVGASARHKRQLSIVEIFVIHFPFVALGAFLGSSPGMKAAAVFSGVSELSNRTQHPPLILITMFSVMLLVTLCYMLPQLNSSKRSIIQSVKGQNPHASEERHGYRESYAFRSQNIVKRIAKKNADYHRKVYRNIALTFSASAFYPILAILLFFHIGNAEIVLDTNPGDAVDTTAATLKAVDHILLFIGACFFVLTLLGVLQALLMSRLQIASRKETARVYLAVGMTEEDIHRMIRLELRSVFFRVFVFLLFAVPIADSCFRMFAGR